MEAARPPAEVRVQTVSQFEEPWLFDYSGEDKLFHQGYEVSRVEDTDTPYVVLKRRGKTIAKFDGVYHPWGNSADFGLFDLLGDKSQQLIVSLTASRGGRHWVVSLQPTFRILFDSAEYGVGREEFLIRDIDKDGVFEILLPKVSFYGMDGLRSVSETPLPEIIFKYDATLDKYLPANHLFVDYALRHVSDESEKETYNHHRFNVLLDYVYAGKEEQGWASYDKYYPSPDKELMRTRIEAILKDDSVYKFFYECRQ